MAKRKDSLLSRSKLFTPSVVRRLTADTTSVVSKTAADLSGTNVGDTKSFRYDPPGVGLKSTQQIPLDFSMFENHTFFNSAESKVNVGFDLIINGFPFDGTKQEYEEFLDNLTGYEKYLYDQFPKSKGFLHFSGSTEPSPSTDGTSIVVKDFAGSLYPSLSKNQTGEATLDSKDRTVGFEFHVYLPNIVNDNQVIFQKLQNNNEGITLALSSSSTTIDCELHMYVSSGSMYTSASMLVGKDKWNHVYAELNRETDNNLIKLYLDSVLKASSSEKEFGNILYTTSSLMIATGSSHNIDGSGGQFVPHETLSGTLDEFRVFHGERSINKIELEGKRGLFSDKNLKLYYKFNEATGSYDSNNLILDSSGNSLHSQVVNFATTLREEYLENPITFERDDHNPVLFPTHEDVVFLNSDLLVSASLYDGNNPNLITKLIPKHYLLDSRISEGFDNDLGDVGEALSSTTDFPGGGTIGSPQLIASLLFTWGKFFDEIKMFTDHFSKLLTVDYKVENTVADQFLPFLAEYYGFQLPAQWSNTPQSQYILGEDLTTNSSVSGNSLQYVQNQLWRRILINMNEILRSKGTIHSVKSLMRSMGINPRSGFRFREFGGASSKKISETRVQKTEVSSLLNFSGSLNVVSSSGTTQGVPDNKPLIMSSYLSSSRQEVGFPEPKGSFFSKDLFSPHGISNVADDGLITSGSWTFEGIYEFPLKKAASFATTQSLARIHVTGSTEPSLTHGITVNLLAMSGSNFLGTTGSLNLQMRPSTLAAGELFEMELTGVDIFDGDRWNVSFGRNRRDETVSDSTFSSYFLRAGKQNFGTITDFHATSSLFEDLEGNTNTFEILDGRNISGSFLVIGSQSINTVATDRFLNSVATVPGNLARVTEFQGKVGHIRFWSKGLKELEMKEHIRNFKSLGIENPLANFNFVTSPTGSFERIRLDVSTDQIVTESNSAGEIILTDFSQNNLVLTGSGFEASKRVVEPERFDFSIISPSFDEFSTSNKIRIRGFQDIKNINELGGNLSPIYEIPKNEIPVDDVRFSIEVSSVQALNEDIINIFSTLDVMDDVLGDPTLMFSLKYPELDNLRKIYFNRLTDKINYRLFFEFFKWFDTQAGAIIEKLIPRKTKFYGVNFIIESHMLERGKMNYQHSDIYLGENDRTNKSKSSILLRQLVAEIKRH